MQPERDPRTIFANLERIRTTIARACDRAGRDPASVLLVAAAKSIDAASVIAARDGGVGDMGENYVQDLRAKRELVDRVRWHFIGTLQSHTANRVAELADVVQTVVPGRAAQRLARRAASSGRTIPVLVEVDLTEGRTGVPPDALPEAVDEIAAMPGLQLRGLMTVPPVPSDAEDARPHFRRLRALLAEVAERHPDATECSMGMSLDYAVAVEEGATMVRIGTALFGTRPAADQGRT